MRRCSRAVAAVSCALGLLVAGAAQAAAAVRPVGLRTEFRADPVGIDTARPVFGWTLQATAPGARGLRQVAYRLRVAPSAARLAQNSSSVWDSGRVAESQYWQRPYTGPPLAAHRTYWWQVQAWTGDGTAGPWSAPARFTTALLGGFDPTARWIAAEADGPPSRPALESEAGQRLAAMPLPLPVFRKGFSLARPVAQALLFVSGLGQAEVTLNGRPVTDAVLQPGWTDYRKTVSYATYDVSAALRPGRNAFGVMLGNGMYNVQGAPGRYTKFVGSYGPPKLLLQLELRYLDGGRARIVSDASWQTRPGPVLYASIFGGEDHDARTLPPGWDRAEFAARDWQPVTLVAGPGGVLAADRSVPMAVIERLAAVRITHPKPGVTVYDLGRTISGWPNITVTGPAGSRVALLPGELLAADGTVTQRSIAGTAQAPVQFSYTLRGGGRERWHPRFSYTSLRYVQVSTSAASPAAARQPTVLALGGDVVHARVAAAGRFATSDRLYGRIHRLIDAAVVSNLASIVTDCPSREKLGWLEQTHLNAATLMFNHEVTPLYEKMADDMADAQQADGLVPAIAPEFVTFVDGNGRSTAFRDSAEWGSALILSPWALFQFTGDDRPLRRHYRAMQRYIEHLARRSTANLAHGGLGDWYDIGANPPGESQLTDRRLTATGVYYQDLLTLARIAGHLGHAADAAGYTERAAAVRDAYNAAFFHPESGQYDRGSQTANAMSLALGLVPAGFESVVRQHLVDDIEAHADHITAGDIGFHYLVRALMDGGRPDVMARILSRTDAPSYGHQLAQGATTLTEAWDANPASSQNHFMLGHAEAWFYRGLAGLSFDMADGPDAAIRLRPSFLAGIASASASYKSPQGEVALAWRRDAKSATVSVTVPPGARAQLQLAAACEWRESGHALDRTAMSTPPDAAGDMLALMLGSGQYHYATSSRACTAANGR